MSSGRDDEEMSMTSRIYEHHFFRGGRAGIHGLPPLFSYDMEIVSRQGDQEIVANLSKKQGSASNGEKQTPYFIILAASLLQCCEEQLLLLTGLHR